MAFISTHDRLIPSETIASDPLSLNSILYLFKQILMTILILRLREKLKIFFNQLKSKN